jgi:ABC-type phosphate transport system substrate-binding protein
MLPKRAAAALSLMALIAAIPSAVRPAVAAAAQRDLSDALAIIVNRANPVEGLTLSELRRIFLLETQTWPNGRKITLVLRQEGQPERAEAIELICRLSESEYSKHVLYQTFRGSVGWGPRSILSAGAMLRFVFNAPGAIGYVPADQFDGTTKVLRINGLLPGDDAYPLQRGRHPGSGHARRR